ncbi:MAG TPA: Wzy polymerase domain-containing protein [Burkholderiales bacterium]
MALLLVGLSWTLPFFSPNFREPIGSFYGEITAIVLGLLAVCCLLLPSLWAGLVLPRSALVFLGFIGLILLHLLIGRNVYAQQNLLAVLYLLWALALAMLAWRLREIFGKERVVAALCWFLLAGTLLSAAIGLCQLWGIRSPLSPFMLPQIHGRIYANTGQPNHLANYLSLGLASLGYLYATRRIGWLATAIALLPLLMVMGFSGSRSVWLYVPALFLLAAVFHFSSRTQATLRLLGMTAVAGIGLLFATILPDLLSAATPSGLETIQGRLGNEGMRSPARMREWYEAWLMFREAPFLGIGYRRFAWHHFVLNAQLPPPRLFEGVVDNAHNLILHTMAEFGLLGLGVLLAGLLAWILGLRRGEMSMQLWWLLAVAAILGIHSMLEYPLWYAYFLGIAAVVAGLSDRVPVTVGRPGGGKLILVTVLLLGWMALANLYQDYRTLQSLHRAAPQIGKGQPDKINTAEILLDLQQHSLLSPFVELALSRLMPLDRGRIEDKVALNGAVMHFAPSADVAYRQAILLAMAGQGEQARVQWDLAEKNFPEDAVSIIALMRSLPEQDAAGLAELIRYSEQGMRKAQ